MGFANRIKERRKQLGLTQGQLASLLGVTSGAVGNYETGVSNPKATVMIKLFEALKCDANYLFQDEMKNIPKKNGLNPTSQEMENFVKKYRTLDDHGKEMVEFMISKEYDRSIQKKRKNFKRGAAHGNS